MNHMGNWLDKDGLIQLKNILATKFATKVDRHPGITSGKFLQTDSHGDAVWGDAASSAIITSVTEAWLSANLSGDASFAIDTSLTVSGAAADAKSVGDADYALAQTLEGKASLSNPNFSGIPKIEGLNIATESYVRNTVPDVVNDILEEIGLTIANGHIYINPVTE